MTDNDLFTDRERRMIESAVKSNRFSSDEWYQLYKKICRWRQRGPK